MRTSEPKVEILYKHVFKTYYIDYNNLFDTAEQRKAKHLQIDAGSDVRSLSEINIQKSLIMSKSRNTIFPLVNLWTAGVI